MSTRLKEDLQTASRTISKQQKRINEVQTMLVKANALLSIGKAKEAKECIGRGIKKLGITALEKLESGAEL